MGESLCYIAITVCFPFVPVLNKHIVMSLPKSFKSSAGYFEKILSFFEKYQHFYSVSNVDILIEGILNEIDTEGMEICTDLNAIERELQNLGWFRDFKRELDDFQSCPDLIETELTDYDDIPIGRKKKQEILALSELIGRYCTDLDVDVVVDLGCGLGYLTQLLHQKFNLKVLGLDYKAELIKSATQRQEKYYPHTKSHVKYLQHKIDSDSSGFISVKARELFPSCEKFVIVGLHACADLIVEAIDVFFRDSHAASLIIMTCCYHKMQLDNDKKGFKNFPCSQMLKQLVQEQNCSSCFKVPFLRLAAQPPFITEDLNVATFRLLSRATLQLYAYMAGKRIVRKRRKAVKNTENAGNIDEYIQDAMNGYAFLCNRQPSHQCDASLDSCQIQALWRQNDEVTKMKTAIFVLIQNYLQPVLENFVLYDRIVYLSELGYENAKVLKIIDQKISPRCFALVVVK